jgi:hypothetical protein
LSVYRQKIFAFRFGNRCATKGKEIVIGEGAGSDLRLGGLDGSLRDLLLPMVSAVVLSETLGVTPRRLQQLAAENILPRATRGLYPLGLCVQRYLEFIKSEG